MTSKYLFDNAAEREARVRMAAAGSATQRRDVPLHGKMWHRTGMELS